MIARVSPILAVALFLVGCEKSTQTSADNKAATNAPAPAPAPPSPPAGATSTPSKEMKTTPSGLKYQVLKQGTGTVSPKATDNVTVHYHGTLLDGSVFDSSVQRNQPASFPLNGVIRGWTEGVQLMKVGDKFKFEIPPDLAYGAAGRPPVIPPNSTLVFEVELLGIQ